MADTSSAVNTALSETVEVGGEKIAMPRTTNVHVFVDASPDGIEFVRIRVPRGHRTEGLTFLGQLLPALEALNRKATGAT